MTDLLTPRHALPDPVESRGCQCESCAVPIDWESYNALVAANAVTNEVPTDLEPVHLPEGTRLGDRDNNDQLRRLTGGLPPTLVRVKDRRKLRPLAPALTVLDRDYGWTELPIPVRSLLVLCGVPVRRVRSSGWQARYGKKQHSRPHHDSAYREMRRYRRDRRAIKVRQQRRREEMLPDIMRLLFGPYIIGRRANGEPVYECIGGQNRYWIATTDKNWSDTSAWSDRPLSSGGVGGFSVPIYGDIANFNIDAGGGVCTLDQDIAVSGIIQQGSHVVDGEMVFSGSATSAEIGTVAQIAHTGGLHATGEFDLQIKLTPQTWYPATSRIIAGSDSGIDGSRSWNLYHPIDTSVVLTSNSLTANQRLVFEWSIDGTGASVAMATPAVSAPFGVDDNAEVWVRVRLTVDGTVVFQKSLDDRASWITVGTAIQPASSGNPFANGLGVSLGSRWSGNTTWSGKVREFELRRDGDLVIDIDATTLPDSTTTFTESSPNAATVTLSTTLSLGSHAITLNGAASATLWQGFGHVDAGTSTITMQGDNTLFAGGGNTYNDITFAGTAAQSITGVNTFTDLIFSAAANYVRQLILFANQTVTGTFTVVGKASPWRTRVVSSDIYAPRTITAAVTSLTNVNFDGVIGAGAAAWTGTSLADLGACSGITFTAPVTRYWVGVTGGYYSDPNNWSTMSGGAGGASVPLPHDTVVWDANSITSTGRIIFFDDRWVPGVDFSNVLNSPIVDISRGPTGATQIFHGSVNLTGVAAVLATTAINLRGKNGSRTFNTGGKTIPNSVTVDTTGTWTLASALTIGSTNTLTVLNGTLDTNGQAVSAGLFAATATGSTTRELILGSSTVTLTGTGTVWNVVADANFTFDSGTSHIVINNATVTGKTCTHTLSSASTAGAGEFYDLTITGLGATNWAFGAVMTAQFHDVSCIVTSSPVTSITLGNSGGETIVVTGTLTVTGGSGANRITRFGGVRGIVGPAIYQVAAFALSNVNFEDCFVDGPAWTGTSLGDGGGNTNITFDAPVTRFWVGGTGNYSDTAHWSTTSGGVGGASFPLPHDNPVWDANSFTADGQVITFDVNRIAGFDFSNVIYTPSLAYSSALSSFAITVWGSADFRRLGSVTGTCPLQFSARDGTYAINGGNIVHPTAITLAPPAVTTTDIYELEGRLQVAASFSALSGTFRTNDHTVIATTFTTSTTGIRTLDLGSSLIILSGSNTTVWNSSTVTGLTVLPNTATVQFNGSSATFGSGNFDYNGLSLVFRGGGNASLAGAGEMTLRNLTVRDTNLANQNGGESNVGTVVTDTFTARGTPSAGVLIGMAFASTSLVWGGKRRLAAANTDLEYVSFHGIIAGGSGSWTGTQVADEGLNEGITFTSSTDTLYWGPANTVWSDYTNWYRDAAYTIPHGLVPWRSNEVKLTATSGNLTIDLANVGCRSLDCTGYTGTLVHNASCFLGVGYGDAATGDVALKFVAGMTYTLGSATTSSISFSTGAPNLQTIDFAGKTVGNVQFGAATVGLGISGGFKLVAAMTTGSNSVVTLGAGTLDTNGQACTWGQFSALTNTFNRTVILGASAVTITGGDNTTGNSYGVSVTNLVHNPGTSTVTLTGTGTAGQPNVNGGSGIQFSTLVLAPGGGAPTTFVLSGARCVDLTFTGPAAKTQIFNIGTIPSEATGTFTIAGNTPANRLIVQSNVAGSTRYINAATTVLSNVDFQDVAAGGGATWTGTSIGDCGRNDGITADTPRTIFWVSNGGNMSDTAHYSLTSGGASGAAIPLAQDMVRVDANSITSGSQTITNDLARIGSVDFTGVLNTPAFSTSNISGLSYCFGDITLISAMSLSATQTLRLRPRSTYAAQVLTSAGKTIPSTLILEAVLGTTRLADALTISGAQFILTSGLLDANGQNVTTSTASNGQFAATGSTLRYLRMGSGTWTLSGTGTIWNTATTGLTILPNTATISITDATATSKTFAAGSSATAPFDLNGASISITGAGSRCTVSFSVGLIVKDFSCTATVARDIGFSPAVGSIAAPLTSTLTVTGTFTVTASGGYQHKIRNNTLAGINVTGATSPVTILAINAAAHSLTNVVFADVTAIGTAWTGTNLGDLGGNTNITFTTGTRYWVGNGGSWTDTAHWSLTSGGASGASAPIPGMTAIFDGNSITSGSQTITCNQEFVPTLNFSSVANTPTISTSVLGSSFLVVVGSINWTGINTVSGNSVSMEPRGGSHTLTTGGKSFSSAYRFVAAGATITLQDNLTQTSSTTGLLFHEGTLDLNGKTITCVSFQVTSFTGSTMTRTLTLGAAAITVSGTTGSSGLVFFASVTTTTITANTATITVSDASATNKTITTNSGGAAGSIQDLGGLSLVIAAGGSGSITFSGSAQWKNITFQGAKTVVWPSVVPVTVTGTLQLQSGTTLTVTTMNVAGKPGSGAILKSSTGGSAATVTQAAGRALLNHFATVRDITVSGANADAYDSTDLSGNTGITFHPTVAERPKQLLLTGVG